MVWPRAAAGSFPSGFFRAESAIAAILSKRPIGVNKIIDNHLAIIDNPRDGVASTAVPAAAHRGWMDREKAARRFDRSAADALFA